MKHFRIFSHHCFTTSKRKSPCYHGKHNFLHLKMTYITPVKRKPPTENLVSLSRILEGYSHFNKVIYSLFLCTHCFYLKKKNVRYHDDMLSELATTTSFVFNGDSIFPVLCLSFLDKYIKTNFISFPRRIFFLKLKSDQASKKHLKKKISMDYWLYNFVFNWSLGSKT